MKAPVTYRWTGDSFVPWRRFAKQCDQEFIIGQDYKLEVVHQRSPQSHSHYFACIEDAWHNIPEIHGNRWLTPDDLRKWALIQAGYFDEMTFICHDKTEALRLAAFLRSIDSQCTVIVNASMVARRIAKSQSLRAMSRKEFQASKVAVLEELGKLIGVPVEDLRQSAGKAA